MVLACLMEGRINIKIIWRSAVIEQDSQLNGLDFTAEKGVERACKEKCAGKNSRFFILCFKRLLSF